MDSLKLPLNVFRNVINNGFADKEPWQIVTITTSTVIFTIWLWEFIQEESNILIFLFV